MSKLKLGSIPDDKPVKLTVELPAVVHRDLLAYAEALGRETGSQSQTHRNWWTDAGAVHGYRPGFCKVRRKTSYRRRGIVFPEKLQEIH